MSACALLDSWLGGFAGKPADTHPKDCPGSRDAGKPAVVSVLRPHKLGAADATVHRRRWRFSSRPELVPLCRAKGPLCRQCASGARGFKLLSSDAANPLEHVPDLKLVEVWESAARWLAPSLGLRCLVTRGCCSSYGPTVLVSVYSRSINSPLPRSTASLWHGFFYMRGDVAAT